MAKRFTRAQGKPGPCRVLLTGASGSGKTTLAIELALGMVGGDPSKVFVIDSELSAHKLCTPDRDFMVAELPDYKPGTYVEYAKDADGPGHVIVIDSLSHLWTKKDGLLDQHIELCARMDSMAAWNVVGRMMGEFLTELTRLKAHLIMTLRAEPKLVVVEGQKKTFKVAEKIEFRKNGSDLEYESDVVFNLEQDHTAACLKDRTGFFDQMPYTVLDPTATGRALADWAAKRDTSWYVAPNTAPAKVIDARMPAPPTPPLESKERKAPAKKAPPAAPAPAAVAPPPAPAAPAPAISKKDQAEIDRLLAQALKRAEEAVAQGLMSEAQFTSMCNYKVDSVAKARAVMTRVDGYFNGHS